MALVPQLGDFDEDDQLYRISSEDLGFRIAVTEEDSKGMEITHRWDKGELAISDPVSVPIASVDASVQGVLSCGICPILQGSSVPTLHPGERRIQ